MHFKGEFLYNFLILFCYFIIGFRRAKSGFLCAKGKSGRKNKKHLPYAPEDEVDAEDVVTYEEVALYYPRADRKRPVVLIGPPNIGRHELRQRLMQDTNRFAAAIPRKFLRKNEFYIFYKKVEFLRSFFIITTMSNEQNRKSTN